MSKSNHNDSYDDTQDGFKLNKGYVPKEERRRLKKLRNIINSKNMDLEELEELGEDIA